jgi:hypothetical protein
MINPITGIPDVIAACCSAIDDAVIKQRDIIDYEIIERNFDTAEKHIEAHNVLVMLRQNLTPTPANNLSALLYLQDIVKQEYPPQLKRVAIQDGKAVEFE